MNDRLTRCRVCGEWVDPALGAEPPGTHETDGTRDNPHEPGDWDDICARCGYAPATPAERTLR